MLSEREIALELVQVVRKMIDKKQAGESDKQSSLYFGYAYGLLVALDRVEGFTETENQLGYINEVLTEILGNPEQPLEEEEGEVLETEGFEGERVLQDEGRVLS